MTMLSAGIITGSSVIEDWEGSTPLSNWSGDDGSFTTQQSTVYEGSTALECTTTSEVSITKDGVSSGATVTPSLVIESSPPLVHSRAVEPS